jgi:RNA polymerase sigma factor (TIGR02999 family)
MAESKEQDLTLLLRAWSQGDRVALDKLTPQVYMELHRLARLYMSRERPDHPLQTTALINEAYIRLIDWKNVRWQSRAHFFAMAATLMRRVLVDLARSRDQAKRGGGEEATTLDDNIVLQPQKSAEILAVDEALTRLEEIDPRKSRVVELRFFAGMSVEETAEAMELSERTIMREWNLARAWLRLEITSSNDRPSSQP